MRLWISSPAAVLAVITYVSTVKLFSTADTGSTDSIKFVLNPGKGQSVLKADDAESVKLLSKFKGLKIYTHGFASSCTSTENTQIPNAYRRSKKDFAAMCVDWARLSYQHDPVYVARYPKASENTLVVGKRIAVVLQFLKDQKVISDFNSVHLIGWSLGGQVMGVAGHQLNGKVGRISGLDPAGPGFDNDKPLSERLDKSDAQYVDCIHTNAGQLGTDLRCGHADFYPNGGRMQLNCPLDEATKDIVDGGGGCSHARAPAYFAKSISKTKYCIACPCKSLLKYEAKQCKCKSKDKVPFGELSKPGTKGTFYMDLK